jgi:hypothetical protein
MNSMRPATARGQGAPGELNAAGATSYRFKLVTFDEIQLLTTAAYLVRDIIPREGLVVIWGPPKCGKSFWTYDAIMHVALGWEYRGRRVKQGTVVYVACEGERGLGARTEAFRRSKLTEDSSVPGFHLLATRLDLVADRQQLIEDIRAQLGDEKPAVIVIDTLNRSIAGSESSDEDMGDYVKAADAIREAFNCAVLIIHHCGVDDKRPRGHTSLTGAADAQIAIRRSADGVITSIVEWMKDGAEGVETNSRLEVVELGTDDDGEPITSCIVVPTETAPNALGERPKKRRPPPPDVMRALEFLKDAITDHGEPLNKPGLPRSLIATTLPHWRDRVRQRGLYDGEAAGRKRFERARERLVAEKLITIDGDSVWIVPRA